MLFKTIFKYEVKQFLRSPGTVAAWVLFFLVGLFCLRQGTAVYTYQQVAADSAQAKVARNVQSVRTILDTTKFTPGKRADIEYPYYLDWKEHNIAAKPLSPLMALSIGQADVYPALKSGRFASDVFTNEYTEFKNPDQLQFGNLDLSFFVLFLFPLLLIALTYNLRSAEREAGMEELIYAQAHSVNGLYRTKLAVRWLIALLPVMALALISFFTLNNKKGFDSAGFLTWWSVAILYCSFWWAGVSFVQRFRASSTINAITLSGAWVLLLIALPGLTNTWLSYRYPNSYKLEAAEFRDSSYKLWDKPMHLHKKVFFATYPYLLKDSATIDSNEIRSYSYAAQSLGEEKALHDKMRVQAGQQSGSEEKGFWFNPVGGVLRSMTGLSGTTLVQQQAFDESLLRYRTAKMQYLFDNLHQKQNLMQDDFEKMPKWNLTQTGVGMSSPHLLPLLVLTVLLAVMSVIRRKAALKNDNEKKSGVRIFRRGKKYQST